MPMSAQLETAKSRPRTTPDAPTNEPEDQSGGRQAGEFNKEFLLETIIYDLLWNGLHIGTLATALTACNRNPTQGTLRPWRHLLHDNCKIMVLALRYGPQIGLSKELSARTSKLYADVAEAKPRLARLVENTGAYSEPERRLLAGAGETWRGFAREAKAVLSEFNAGPIARAGDLLAEDAHMLCQFLEEASAGSVKRVGADGEIVLPTLKQMRRSPRVKIAGRCTIVFDEKSIAAELRDIAPSGLGVICRHPLPENRSLTIVMDDGRRLTATVANRSADRVGLLFEFAASARRSFVSPGRLAFSAACRNRFPRRRRTDPRRHDVNSSSPMQDPES